MHDRRCMYGGIAPVMIYLPQKSCRSRKGKLGMRTDNERLAGRSRSEFSRKDRSGIRAQSSRQMFFFFYKHQIAPRCRPNACHAFDLDTIIALQSAFNGLGNLAQGSLHSFTGCYWRCFTLTQCTKVTKVPDRPQQCDPAHPVLQLSNGTEDLLDGFYRARPLG